MSFGTLSDQDLASNSSLSAYVAREVPGVLMHQTVALEGGGVGERHLAEAAAKLVGIVYRVQVVPHPRDKLLSLNARLLRKGNAPAPSSPLSFVQHVDHF